LTITPTTISLSEQCCTFYAAETFNGFLFTNLTFADGGSLGSVTLSASNMPGISPADVTVAAQSISINLQGVTVGSNSAAGVFTLTLSEAPELSTWLLLGGGLAALGLVRRYSARA
jgi:hypothetical protein